MELIHKTFLILIFYNYNFVLTDSFMAQSYEGFENARKYKFDPPTVETNDNPTKSRDPANHKSDKNFDASIGTSVDPDTEKNAGASGQISFNQNTDNKAGANDIVITTVGTQYDIQGSLNSQTTIDNEIKNSYSAKADNESLLETSYKILYEPPKFEYAILIIASVIFAGVGLTLLGAFASNWQNRLATKGK